ncbi:threonine--tRNA ligase [Eubacterium saphenum ATCC 49989]|nr:threonine--tRNA ligase [Eubacterium saphenum ATCC 49989]
MGKEKVDFSDENVKEAYRHTSSHIMAQAIKRLWPEAKLAIGPAIKDGFYYDVDLDHKITDDDLKKIQKEMKKIIKANYPLEKSILSRDKALELMRQKDEDYKVELINDLPSDEEISFYTQGEFTDLCAGPHVESTGKIKAIKLMSVAGAYWRGNEKNKMLQRVYGTAFSSQEELQEYIDRIEEAKKRDHRKIGKEMDLFALMEEGPGFPFFLPNGMILRTELENYWRQEHRKRGYDEIKTPLILSEELWHTSGHYDHYKENMYFTSIDDAEYAIKPMNCPGAMLTYKRKLYSYRDFPIRLAELGQVHRHELHGALHGLMRVRTFTQDDAHIFMTPDIVKDEIKRVVSFIDDVYNLFGFKYHIELSTRPEDSMGTDEEWNHAIDSLEAAIKEMGKDYVINEGDGAFYGPKLDFHLEDSLGRTWQCGTIQLDFQMPQKFDLTYVGSDGEKHRPIIIHRVIFGSIERFIGILIEHFAGKFPLWLAPEQVRLLTVTEKFVPYAEKVSKELAKHGIRVKVDARNEKIGYKLRQGRNERVSYLAVIGEREAEADTLSVRSSKEGDLGSLSIDKFIDALCDEIATKKL